MPLRCRIVKWHTTVRAGGRRGRGVLGPGQVAAAEHLWTVAVNNWGGLGRWAFLEITDPWDAEHLIREKYLEPSPALT